MLFTHTVVLYREVRFDADGGGTRIKKQDESSFISLDSHFFRVLSGPQPSSPVQFC